MNSSTRIRNCNELRRNIPWYLNGTLADKAAVILREHLQNCSDCQADFAIHAEMRASVLGRELAPLKPVTRAEDIIGDDTHGVGKLSGARSFTSRRVAVAASIAIFGVVLIVALYPENDADVGNQLFQTATSEGSTDGIDYVLQLQFERSVAESERARIAAQLNGAVKWAVNDKGVYEVHIKLAAPTLQGLKKYEEHAEALTGVQSAKFTALQLPMR
ncbi:MAG TPA: zf-HC2 domain-containing protein [Woeseiaceae bacterium]|nr:zf-HC2 domain-containing protein [Woeseiaceae bacterium]